MGAHIETHDGHLPLTVTGASLNAIDYELPVASAQVKSAVLLAGLGASGRTTVIEPVPTRDHTELMLRHFGAEVRVEQTQEGRVVSIQGQPELTGRVDHAGGHAGQLQRHGDDQRLLDDVVRRQLGVLMQCARRRLRK